MLPTRTQSPWTGFVGGVTALFLCSVLGIFWGQPGFLLSSFNRDLLLWSIILLIFVIMGLIDQVLLGGYRADAPHRPAYHRDEKRLMRSAVMRYLALLVLLTGVRAIYEFHPLYQGNYYAPFIRVLPWIYGAYVWLGLPYIWLTLRWRGHLRDEMKDPGLHVLLWLKWLYQKRWKQILNSRSKIVLLGFLVEFFFLPLMTVFLSQQFSDYTGWLKSSYYGYLPRHQSSEAFFKLGYHGLYMVDVFLAMGGYLLPSRWLGNKIQSVEPTLKGWVVALICYPPFDSLVANYAMYSAAPTVLTQAFPSLYLLLRFVSLGLEGFYVWATMAFGTRFSNLTHRGILTRGPYAIVRHPAYVSKNLTWWIEKLPLMSNPLNILALLFWNGVYVLRALTEEKHLSKDPAYRAYCARVKYRFIPGVI